eukprot:9710160-Lingulodinium_polyedra.AAC.1
MRSNRPSAAATARKSHASHTQCKHQFLAFERCAKRATCEPLQPRTADLTASLRNVCRTLHNDAVAIAVRRRSGSLIARSRTPRAR